MKTDEPRDDEILGRALSRAIETAEVKETPYEGSRIALHPKKSGGSLWRVAALAASVAIAVALGSTLFDRPATDQSVGQQPTPSVAPTQQGASATPGSSSSTAQPNAIDHQRVFVAQDGLPPTSRHLDGVLGACAACLPGMSGVPTTVADRITSRLNNLNRGFSGITGTHLNADPKLIYPASVKVNGDVATVDYTLPAGGWPMRGSASSLAWQQELVYSATEEPGIRRLLVTENGGKRTTIDQLVWDKPLAREDVSGYGSVKNEQVSESVLRACSTGPCPSAAATRLSNTFSVDSIAPGVTRFVVQLESGLGPDFSTEGYATSDDTKAAWSGKFAFRLKVSGTEIKPGLEIVDRTPLRSIRSTVLEPAVGGGTLYELALDDLRPWRAAILQNPDRIVVDFGGYPAAISDTVVVYSPKPGDTGRQFTVSGLSRTFEATTAWRVVDSARRVLASGFTQASRGTSAVWGTFQTAIELPASVSGNVTLEVFWASPRDGADTGLVQVPLTVR
jgi:hypothetical protein